MIELKRPEAVLEERFAELAQAIYQSGERRIQPTWPWVLIRTVPKEQKFGSLILPDNDGAQKQHKPLLEGIVLCTWLPHWGAKKEKNGTVQEQIWRQSEFKVGDRILYPHFSGLPVKYLDETKYRLVREWTFDPDGGVMCKVDYRGDKKMKDILDAAFNGVQSVTMSGR